MTLEEVKQKWVGMKGDVTVNEVDKSSIKRHVEAVGDHNPLFQDEEHAQSAGHPGLVAPPAFFGRDARAHNEFPKIMMDLLMDMMGAGYPGILDGGVEYDFYRIVHAGDTLSSAARVEGITEKTTKAGKAMLFVAVVCDFINQRGQLVATQKTNLICLAL